MLLKGFPPVIDAHVDTLILGSFPGQASLAAAQYYAHPRNQFWRVISALVNEPLFELPYAQRLSTLLAHHIGLWDVLAACQREGSLDSAIQDARPNDFLTLKQQAPKLIKVLFNGKTAGRFADQFAAAGFQVAVMPSTSPAYASLNFEQKLALWRAAINVV